MKQRNPLRQYERSPHDGILELPRLIPGRAQSPRLFYDISKRLLSFFEA